MGKQRDALAEALEHFVGVCEGEAPAALATMRLLRDEWLVARTRDAAARQHVARRVEGLYGGMGSINDYPWSREAEDAKEELWRAARGALRDAWRDLGHECHDPASFVLLEVGSKTRMIEGATLLVRSDGSRHHVRRGMERRTWEVRGVEDADVTGMPIYSLKNGNRYVLARHDALERLAPPDA